MTHNPVEVRKMGIFGDERLFAPTSDNSFLTGPNKTRAPQTNGTSTAGDNENTATVVNEKPETPAPVDTQLPLGTRIVLDLMPDDPEPITPGTQGTILSYDGVGDIIVDWDATVSTTGRESKRGLHLIPGVDRYHVLNVDSAEELERAFDHLASTQDKMRTEGGETERCPRCSQIFDVHRGAVSRRFPSSSLSTSQGQYQIMICPSCGTREALEDFVINGTAQGLDVNVYVPKDRRPGEEGDGERERVKMNISILPLKDWYIVKKWTGRDSAVDEHKEVARL